MNGKYPYPRWYLLRWPSPFERVRAVRARIRHSWKRHRERLWDKYFSVYALPLIEYGSDRPGQWMPGKDGKPRFEGPTRWRTKHGRATLIWQWWGKWDVYRAVNVKLPNGRRGTVFGSAGGVRRRGDAPRLWTYGDVEVQANDALFHDREPRPPSDPMAWCEFELEKALAGNEEFMTALQDDVFAYVAFGCFTRLDWFKIGDREAEAFGTTGHIACMIAELRDKGENYLDYKLPDGPPRAFSANKARRCQATLERIIHSLGWRTYTTDELRAMAKADFDERVAVRVALLRDVRRLEQRPAALHASSKLFLGRGPQALDILDTDDPAWMGELSAEQREAAAGGLGERVHDLAETGRVSPREAYDLEGRLAPWLKLRPPPPEDVDREET